MLVDTVENVCDFKVNQVRPSAHSFSVFTTSESRNDMLNADLDEDDMLTGS